MRIGIDAVGVFEGDLPENVVVMQIGVSRFGKCGSLTRIGHVVPRSAKKMCRMLSSASHYVASTIEEKVYPIPSAVRRKLAPTARAVAMLAVFVVTRMQTVSVGSTRSIGKFLKYIVRGAATWFDEEFLQQPALLWILAGVVATNYWFFR